MKWNDVCQVNKNDTCWMLTHIENIKTCCKKHVQKDLFILLFIQYIYWMKVRHHLYTLTICPLYYYFFLYLYTLPSMVSYIHKRPISFNMNMVMLSDVNTCDKGHISVLQTVNFGWFSAFNVESKHLMSIFWLIINEECIVTPDW